MRDKLIKIAAVFLGIFILTMSAFSDEYGLTGIGRSITLEKGVIKDLPVNAVIRMKNSEQLREIAKFGFPGVSNQSNIKNLPANDIIRKNIEKPDHIARFGFPEEIVKSWAMVLIPTVFVSNFKLIIEGK